MFQAEVPVGFGRLLVRSLLCCLAAACRLHTRLLRSSRSTATASRQARSERRPRLPAGEQRACRRIASRQRHNDAAAAQALCLRCWRSMAAAAAQLGRVYRDGVHRRCGLLHIA